MAVSCFLGDWLSAFLDVLHIVFPSLRAFARLCTCANVFQSHCRRNRPKAKQWRLKIYWDTGWSGGSTRVPLCILSLSLICDKNTKERLPRCG